VPTHAQTLQPQNNSGFDLRYINNEVISSSYIPQHTSLGIMKGQLRYLYEFNDSDIENYDNLYTIDSERDILIDVSNIDFKDRDIISFIKYGEYNGIPGNCKIKANIDYQTGICTAIVYTIRDIQIGEILSMCVE
jgi:hypothetical protein